MYHFVVVVVVVVVVVFLAIAHGWDHLRFSGSEELLQVSAELGERAFDEESHHQGAAESNPGDADVGHEQVHLGEMKLPCRSRRFEKRGATQRGRRGHHHHHHHPHQG